MGEDKDYLVFSDHMLRGASALDSLYHTMKESDPIALKLKKKASLIQKIILSLDTLTLSLSQTPSKRFKGKLPNNAYFMNFRRYQAKQDDFWDVYRNNFNADLKAYIQHLSKKHPFL
jgi:hypothetical protein